MDKLVVTGYYLDSAAVRDQIKIGDIITIIDDVTVEELVKKNLYLTPASNYETQLRNLQGTLLQGQTSQRKLQIERDGKRFTIEIKTFPENLLNMKLDYVNPNPADK